MATTAVKCDQSDPGVWLTVNQAAEEVHIAPEVLREAAFDGSLKASIVPGRKKGMRIRRANLWEWMDTVCSAALAPRQINAPTKKVLPQD